MMIPAEREGVGQSAGTVSTCQRRGTIARGGRESSPDGAVGEHGSQSVVSSPSESTLSSLGLVYDGDESK
jgi:hypothetical protein